MLDIKNIYLELHGKYTWYPVGRGLYSYEERKNGKEIHYVKNIPLKVFKYSKIKQFFHGYYFILKLLKETLDKGKSIHTYIKAYNSKIIIDLKLIHDISEFIRSCGYDIKETDLNKK